jgi:hypothetical protein
MKSAFIRSIRVICVLLTLAITTHAQERTVTVGLQAKPIFPVKFLKTGAQTVSQNGIDFTVTPKIGYSGGMVIRWGFTNSVSLETGINYVKRNYNLEFKTDTFAGTSDFGIVNYQIPISALVFIRLSDKLYMNASAGLSLDMFVSDIHTYSSYFNNYSQRNGVFQSGVLANLGWEYRTLKSGYFYIGASFQRPFAQIYNSSLTYFKGDGTYENTLTKLNGSYLTFDVRYFFPPLPINKKVKKTKKEKAITD